MKVSQTSDIDKIDKNTSHDDDDIENGSKTGIPLSKTSTSSPPYTVFGRKTRYSLITMVALSALISPFAATLYFPVLTVLAADLNVSDSLINLTVTSYMICQAIAPAIVAGISDTNGRKISFIICFAIFLVANIGLALQNNYAALLVLRMLQSTGSSGTIALTMAVVSDISTSAERGKYSGFASAGILFGPAIGPVIGGILAQYLGWRSIFWFLVIFSCIFLILFVFIVPETCRNIVGNGSIPAKGIHRSYIGCLVQKQLKNKRDRGIILDNHDTLPKQKKAGFSPLQTLKILGDAESALLLIFNSIAFAAYMMINSALPFVLQSAYHYSIIKIALCYIPIGVGALLTSVITGYIMDWNFRRHAGKAGLEISRSKQQLLRGFPLEQARLETMWPGHIVAIFLLIGFGWAIHYSLHIAVILVLLFFLSCAINSAFATSNVFLIDLHRESPATATAAVNLTRCLASAGGVAAIVPMINSIGRGWSFTLLAFIDISLIPVLIALHVYGPKWREKKELKKELQEQLEQSQEGSKTSK